MTLLKDADDKQIQFENHYFEALKYKAIGNYTRAITELEKCQQLFTDDTSIAFELSRNYFQLKKYNEAELYIAKALKNDTENYWFLEHTRNIYLGQYNYSKAIEIQQKIVDNNPKKKEDLVLVYLQAKKYKDAQEIVEELESSNLFSSRLSRFKEIISVYYSKSTIVVKPTKINNQKENLTLEQLRKAFENEKQFSVLVEVLNQEFSNQSFDNLLTYSNKGLELFPAQPVVYLMNARAQMHIKEYNAAIDVLNDGIDFVVDNVNLEIHFHEQLATCYESTNQQMKAKEHREKLIELKKRRQ